MKAYKINLLLLILMLAPCSGQAQWVRCFGSGPWGEGTTVLSVLGPYTYAATTGGGIFRSTNSGERWSLVCKTDIGFGGMVVSGSKIFAASDSLYLSTDSGLSWQGLSLLPVEAGPLVVFGTNIFLASFDGIYLSSDLGLTWGQSGYMFDVVSLLAKNGILYAGAYSFGMYQSTDTGQTWTDFTQGSILDGASVQSIAASGNDIFVGGYYDEGFFRSTDNGVSWDTSNNGMPNKGIPNRIENNFCTIMALYQDGTDLLAGTTEGLFISRDSGANWRLLSTVYAPVLIKSGANLLAASNGGIYLSSDNGATWTYSNAGFINTGVPTLASVGTHIFAGINGSGVFRSDDSGATWIAPDTGSVGREIDEFISIDTNLFTIIGTALYKSSDLGETWDSVSNQISWPMTSIGSSLIAVSSQLFYLSTDRGVSWTKRDSKGFVWGQGGPMMAKGSNLYAGDAEGDCGTVYLSTDSGSSWADIDLGAVCSWATCIASDGDSVFCGTGGGFSSSPSGIFRTGDNGSKWTEINSGFPDTNETGITSIVCDSQNIFFGSGVGVFHSTNYGNSWDSINEGLTSLVIEQLIIVPPYIFAGTGQAGIWQRLLSDFIPQSAVSEASSIKKEIISYPNPFSQSTQISFTSESAGYADISIVNLLGEQVARLFSGELDAGTHSFTFSSTAALPDGMYECLVRMNGRVEKVGMLLLH